MALVFGYRKVFRLFCRKILIAPFIIYKNKSNKFLDIEVDSLDVFTSRLIQKKIDKWNVKFVEQLSADKTASMYKETNNVPEIKLLSEDKINTIFQQIIEIEDNETVINLLLQCVKYKKCTSLSNITYVLTLCAQSGNKKMIITIAQFCKDMMPSIAETNSDFKHFLAEAIWVKGNSVDSLKLFEEVYKNNVFLRRRIRLTLKYLINNVTSHRSEAALINLIKFSKKLFNDYQDIFLLACVWQASFLSEWFHDQRLALELFEKYSSLRRSATNRIPYVVSVSLRCHRTEVVYRLLEVLLKYEMKSHYPGVILALFNYHFQQRDLKNCVEIVKWSIENEVSLPAIQHEQFLELVLNSQYKESVDVKKLCTQKKTIVPTEFKF